jgi:hypothetical protein
MTARKSAGTSLESAQEALEQTTALIADLEAQRRAALLGDDDGVVSRLSNRLEGLRRQRQTDLDRVTARFEEAEREAAERAAQEKAELIGRIEEKFRERDAAGAELAQLVAQSDAAFVRVLELGQEIAAMWEWKRDELGAVLCAAGPMTSALQGEIYRVAGRPNPGGGLPHLAPPSYPGGHPADFMWAMIPERSAKPLTERFAEATAAAGTVMRIGRNIPAPPSVPIVVPLAVPASPDAPAVPSPEPLSKGVTNGHAVPEAVPDGNVPVPTIGSPEQLDYSMLLARQVALVEGPQTEAAEKEYASIGKRLQKLAAAFQ